MDARTVDELSSYRWFSHNVMAATHLDRYTFDNLVTRSGLTLDPVTKHKQMRVYTLEDVYRLAILKWLSMATRENRIVAGGLNAAWAKPPSRDAVRCRDLDNRYVIMVRHFRNGAEVAFLRQTQFVQRVRMAAIRESGDITPTTHFNLTELLVQLDYRLSDELAKSSATEFSVKHADGAAGTVTAPEPVGAA